MKKAEIEKLEKLCVNKSGKINEKRFFAVLNLSPDPRPTRVVPDSSALTAKQCNSGSSVESTPIVLESQLEQLLNVDWKLYLISILQFRYGLRISEVLDLYITDLLPNNYLKIVSKKKSENRLLPVHDLIELFNRFNMTSGKFFEGYNRFYIYRIYKKMGISAKFGNSTRNSVTHLFRHQLVKYFKANNIETSTTQSFIGHKSIKSTEHYEK